MKLNLGLVVMSLALLFGAQQAKADAYIGGLIGYGTATGSAANYTGGLALGATAGIQLVPNLGVGVTYLHNALKVGDVSVGVSQYLVEANFFTVLFFPSGVHVGTVNTSVDNGGSESDLGFGLHTGFDIHIVDNVTVGAAAYWTYDTTTNDHHSIFDVIVPIKFHF